MQKLNSFCHLLSIIFLILFSFTLTSNSEVNSCGHVHRTYFDSSRTQLTGSGIYYLGSVIWVCSWLFYNWIEGWRPWGFSSFSSSFHYTPALQRDLKVRIGEQALGTGFTSVLETQLFLIYKCLVVCKSVSVPKLHIKVSDLCCTQWGQECMFVIV